MPTYIFVNKETGEQFEKFMKISERDQYLKDHPELQPGLTACAWQEAAFGGRKPDAGFKEVLQKIKERTPGGYKMKSSLYNILWKTIFVNCSQNDSTIFVRLGLRSMTNVLV